ncbi:O-methyltransferase [Nonomuraea longispora]|uniref:O-methyltransferase n=1 Tax=Nonomuraea longispora TaxID=1848320 RepID=A0A4R4NKE7_9ACTN|nr:methyltransferase [Nonomuraea longispora]TDC08180.1 O-methyltransferase [Nonomuraea longispora]
MTNEPSPMALSTPPYSDDRPDQEQVLLMLAGKWITGVLHVVARLGIADLLADGPRTVEDLAGATEAHERTLYRFLRAAASVGVFAERPDGRFELTPKAQYLRSDVPGSLRNLAHFYGETTVWNCWGHVMDTVRTGEAVGPKLRGGKTWFQYLEQDAPEFAEVFHGSMTALNDARAPRIAGSFDFGRFPVVADIGGGQGQLLSAILRRHPAVRGILYDIPTAIKGARELLAREGVGERVHCEEGSFFESVPSGADAYVLKAIMHDWSDAECAGILRRVRQAIGGKPEARLLIIDGVLPELNAWHYSKLMDLAMLVNDKGAERTAEEWRRLLQVSGFELVGIHPTAPPHGIVEGRPA